MNPNSNNQHNTNSSQEDELFYCNSCLSLKIKELQDNPDVCICMSCGNTDIVASSFDVWNDVYLKENGVAYLQQTKIKSVLLTSETDHNKNNNGQQEDSKSNTNYGEIFRNVGKNLATFFKPEKSGNESASKTTLS